MKKAKFRITGLRLDGDYVNEDIDKVFIKARSKVPSFFNGLKINNLNENII